MVQSRMAYNYGPMEEISTSVVENTLRMNLTAFFHLVLQLAP
jgi:hypothetical protein